MAQVERVVATEAGAAVIEHPRMRWGAVIAGWLVATGIAFLLYVGGLAIGFSAVDPHDLQAVAKGIGVGTCLWLVLTWVVALFLGGIFASWSDGRDDPSMGAVQGVTVWGLAVAASGLLLAMGMGGALGGGAMLLSGAAAPAGTSVPGAGWQGAGSGDAADLLQAQLVQQVRQQGQAQPGSAGAPGEEPADRAPPWVGPRTAQATTMALLAGHPDVAKALLSGNTSLSPAAVTSLIQGLSPEVEHARNDLKAAAATTAHYSAVAMWILLAAVLLSLLAAALGGCLGASHVHRVYHLRRYARSFPR